MLETKKNYLDAHGSPPSDETASDLIRKSMKMSRKEVHMDVAERKLREFVSEEVRRVVSEGVGKMKPAKLDDLKKWKGLHSYISNVYRDQLPKLKFAIEGGGFFGGGKPYVYVPSEDQAISWSDELNRVTRHTASSLLDAVMKAGG
jgi:hypothetical protein